MSATNSVGNLIRYGGTNCYFAAVNIGGGRVSEMRQRVLEELVANGVDGRRWRKRFVQYLPFTMETVADGNSWTAGLADAKEYEALTGEFATMTLTIANTTRVWKNVKILRAAADLKAGKLVGTGADPASAYVLYGSWNLVLTEAAQ